MKAILFDCDGTLADSFGLIIGTMRQCFAAAGLPVPDDAATSGVIGLSLDLAIHQLAPTLQAEELPRMVALYKSEFQRVRAAGTFPEALFPGAEDLLRRLARREDVLLGMVTGKSRRGVRSVIETHALDGVFAAIRTADDCQSKPHPAMVLECCAELGIEPADCVVVGDAIFDMQMAVSAKASAIGVSWGAQPVGALTAAGAGRVAATMGELSELLEEWLELRPAFTLETQV
ncbi:HAD-IA family hydrolase [Aureimonas sp. ME7]|uniref:HAD-IA family hydrolase n=1 Tax=Aureimonas sp. ME7 TaxID=2744252 RepID=UPI0015F40B0B|nr:HAD-IA family hydrolase [Aureimonas sp. ME7]